MFSNLQKKNYSVTIISNQLGSCIRGFDLGSKEGLPIRKTCPFYHFKEHISSNCLKDAHNMAFLFFFCRRTELESEEIVSELVHSFLLPEVQKTYTRDKSKEKY